MNIKSFKDFKTINEQSSECIECGSEMEDCKCKDMDKDMDNKCKECDCEMEDCKCGTIEESNSTIMSGEVSLSNDAPKTKSAKYSDPSDSGVKKVVKTGKEVRVSVVSFKDFSDNKKETPLAKDLGKVVKTIDKSDSSKVLDQKIDKDLKV